MIRTIWILITFRSGGSCTSAPDGVFRHVPKVDFGWTADLNTRINTVSSIEREIQALPALRVAYKGDSLQASAKAGAGYFFFEIDDDAPREREAMAGKTCATRRLQNRLPPTERSNSATPGSS